MTDKIMCVYSEMETLQSKFDAEAAELSQTATDMQAFQDNTVSTAISDFKAKMTAFAEQITQTENDLKSETTRVCGDGYEGGVGWLGESSRRFVEKVENTGNDGLAGCFNIVRQDIEEINNEFTKLEAKISEVITELKRNVEKVSDFCINDSEFTTSKEEAFLATDRSGS